MVSGRLVGVISTLCRNRFGCEALKIPPQLTET
jgi:hypothetical protein